MPSNRQSQGATMAPQRPGNIRRQTVVTRTRTAGGTQETRTQYEDPESYRAPQAKKAGKPGRRGYGAPGIGSGASNGGVGLLIAEFLLIITFLVLIFFIHAKADFSKAIMSFVKRGTLTCLLFFLLALIAAIGPNASRIAKAIGAVILVAIILTTDISTGLTDVDNIIKNDWAGTADLGTAKPASNSGTPSTNLTNPLSNLSNLAKDLTNPGFFTSNVLQAIKDALNLSSQAANAKPGKNNTQPPPAQGPASPVTIPDQIINFFKSIL